MLLKNNIFNFVSNSYSQFLSEKQNDRLGRYGDHPHRQIYLSQKKQARFYQLTFFSFSLVFFILGNIIFFNTTNWACSLYFKHCIFIKSALYTFCFSLAALTAWWGYFIRPAHDAAKYLFYKMEKRLKELYWHHRHELGNLLQPEQRLKKILFQQNYDQTIDRMYEQKEHALHAIDAIARSYPTSLQENLITQVLSDLQQELHTVLNAFKK
jgi:hypothetical protein